MRDFTQIEEVKKTIKKHYFRIFGVIVKDSKDTTAIGYVIYDDSRQKVKLFTIAQVKDLVLKNCIVNATIYEGKIINTECSMNRLPVFDTHCKLVKSSDNVLVTVLAEVVGEKSKAYKIVDCQLKTSVLSEENIIKLAMQGSIKLVNAKIVKKEKETHVSAIVGTFDKIEIVKPSIKKEHTFSVQDKNKYLTKWRKRFKTMWIDRCTCTYVGITGGKMETGYTFKDNRHKEEYLKALKRYVLEYATLNYPKVVSTINAYMIGKGVDAKNYDYINYEIAKYLTIYEAFTTGEKPVRKFIGYGRIEFINTELLEEMFVGFVKSQGDKMLDLYVDLLICEQMYLAYAKRNLNTFVSAYMNTSDNIFITTKENSRTDVILPIRKGLKEQVDKYFEASSDFEPKEVKTIFDNMTNCLTKEDLTVDGAQRIHDYFFNNLHVYTTILQANCKEGRKKEKIRKNENKPKYDFLGEDAFTKLKTLDKFGYSVQRQTSKRYIFEDVDITLPEKNDITKMATCLGDFSFCAFIIKKAQDLRSSGARESEKLDNITAVESALIILAIYNPKLAKYMQRKVACNTIDIDLIAEEAFSLTEEDKVFYQSGGRFNTRYVAKGSSWSGMSKMPQGLKTVCSTYISCMEVLDMDRVFDHMYLKYWY